MICPLARQSVPSRSGPNEQSREKSGSTSSNSKRHNNITTDHERVPWQQKLQLQTSSQASLKHHSALHLKVQGITYNQNHCTENNCHKKLPGSKRVWFDIHEAAHSSVPWHNHFTRKKFFSENNWPNNSSPFTTVTHLRLLRTIFSMTTSCFSCNWKGTMSLTKFIVPQMKNALYRHLNWR